MLILYSTRIISTVERKRKIKLTIGHVEDIGSTMGIHSYKGQWYEGVMSEKFIAISRHPHLYVMTVPYGARVVRILLVCMAAPC